MENRLREIRKAIGLTLEQVEELTGIDSGNLSRIETGQARGWTMTRMRIAEALALPERFIFEENSDEDAK